VPAEGTEKTGKEKELHVVDFFFEKAGGLGEKR
jgi:hypothetical protein